MEQSGKEVAGFVMKTYQMVSDPSTDHIIGWGTANNSFEVLEPLEFAPIILPTYFKHNNFSSFVRQLNTYGFRKVDPDKWEFANKYFLRGQNHLLSSIVRRKHPIVGHDYYFQLDDDQRLLVEIQRLRDDQRALDKELDRMNQRLEVTERRPQQIMAFLNQVARNPDILPNVIMQRDLGGGEKRRRLMGWATAGAISSTNTTRATFDVDQSFPYQDKNVFGSLNLGEHCNWAEMSGLNPGLTVYDPTNASVDVVEHVPEHIPPIISSLPYPFSLFDGGFYV